MRFSGIFAVALTISLFSCNKKEDKKPVISDLIDNLDFTKDAVFDSTNVPQHLRKIVKDMSSLNVYETEEGGKGAIDTPLNFSNFRKLYKAASEEELLTLTDNKNQAVSVYSAIALTEKNPQYLENVFQQFLNRNEIVHTQNGCIYDNHKIAEPLYWSYFQSVKNNIQSDEILQNLDTQIIFNSNSSDELLKNAFENRIYSGAYKKQIEDLAFRYHKIPAIIYLTDQHKREYSVKLQKEYSQMLENENLFKGAKQRYLVKFLSFNNPENRDIILDYLKKDTIFSDQYPILFQLKNNGISPNEIPLK